VEYRSFDSLLSESDILSVHMPLSDETKGLIGREELDQMKQGSILINVSRAHAQQKRCH
jgi:D-3-phosphoglycerate dehydrogenase